MELLLVRRIDCLSRACNLEDPAVLPKVQKGTSSLAPSLWILACCWGLPAFRKLHPGSCKGASCGWTERSPAATLPCADPLPPVGYFQALLPSQSLPAWHGTGGRLGAVSPGLGRTQWGRGWCIQGVEFGWHGKKGGRTRCVTRGKSSHRRDGSWS